MPIRRTKTQRTADVSNDFDEIVASALIDVTTPEDARYLRAVLAIGKRNSADPWRWYKGIGEVHYALSRGARIAGYVGVAERGDLHRAHAGRDDDGHGAVGVVDGLRSLSRP